MLLDGATTARFLRDKRVVARGTSLAGCCVVLLSTQRAELNDVGARLFSRELLHPHFRMRVTENWNVVTDDCLFPRPVGAQRRERLARPGLVVVLAGRARVRAFGRERWLTPGDVTLIGDVHAVALRQEGTCFRSLSLEWSGPAPFPRDGSAVLTLAPPALALVQAESQHFVSADLCVAEAAARLRELLAHLGACGLPLPPHADDEWNTEAAPPDVRVSRALDRALSCMNDRPMVVDLERDLAVGARQVRRLVTDFNERYRARATSWRDMRSQRRLAVGVAFMTSEGARPERVARVVGYASAATFCRALAHAGLPSPARLRETMRALG